jgi:hypothetical protein
MSDVKQWETLGHAMHSALPKQRIAAKKLITKYFQPT